MSIPRAPQGAGPSGRRLWRAVLAEFELSDHEELLLVQAVRTVDRIDQLHAQVEADGQMIRNRLGELVVHPALVEARLQRILLARLIVALRVPLGEETDHGERPQLRAVRGAYAPRSG